MNSLLKHPIIKLVSIALIFGASLCSAAISMAESKTEIDKAAPDFTLPGSDGKEHTLSSYKGKIVVLEWLNYECPFVKKHYHEPQKNMQTLQETATQDGIVWLSISSSAEGKQGYLTAADAQKLVVEKGTKSSATLLDHDGKVGKLYGARTTPHLFIIDAQGTLRYMGAIDDKASTDADDIANSKNYVKQALDELRAGKKVTESVTESYGCSIKYAF